MENSGWHFRGHPEFCTGSRDGVHEAEYSDTKVMKNWGSLAGNSISISYSSSEGGRFCFTFLKNDALKL